MSSSGRNAVVIGGGIAGLCAAYDLVRAGWQVTLHEASGRFGGKIWSSPVGDRLVDAGPDTFLARVEPGRLLCEELGLASQLTSPVAPVPAYLARKGRLHKLPEGAILGVPTDLDALASSGLISADGVERARRDLTWSSDANTDSDSRSGSPLGEGGEDVSVGAVCRARLGDEITDILIDPILGGINASDLDRLSLAAGAPMLHAALRANPSLIEGLRALRPSTGPTFGGGEAQPVFYGLPGGIATITDALVAAIEGSAKLCLNSPVASLADVAHTADAIIVAVPSEPAAQLVRPVSPDAATELDAIDYASVAQVTVEIPKSGIPQELDASGILFPRVEGTILTASTWFSTKWAHYRRPDSVLIRLTSGRYGDERPAELSDAALTDHLLGELAAVVPITSPPTATRVHRWHRALPQYTPGHATRVDRIEAALAADGPNVRLVGAAYHGIGIPACIDHARRAARSIVDGLG